ncbi:MAG: hypothetical protein ACNA8P_00110 [Phycisphaerales bacterium]
MAGPQFLQLLLAAIGQTLQFGHAIVAFNQRSRLVGLPGDPAGSEFFVPPAKRFRARFLEFRLLTQLANDPGKRWRTKNKGDKQQIDPVATQVRTFPKQLPAL